MGGKCGTRAALFGLCGLLLSCATGCPVISNREAPGREIAQTDPDYGRRYHLYVPTRYNESGETRAWPLVVSCHGTMPWDTAQRQFDEWKGLAEQKGFLLVAPELVGTRGDFVPKAPEQIALQLEDEKAILSIVRSVQAGRAVDPTRVFLTGWSGGGYAVLFTGLRHPEVFRALAVMQGNFDPAFVEPCIPFLDRFQAVQVMYGEDDLLKEHAKACIDWFHRQGMEPTVLARPGIHRRDPDPVFAFFANVVRTRPWVRLEVHDDPLDAMHIHFGVKCSFATTKFLWDFGDKTDRSALATPDHRYGEAGFYDVRVAIWPDKGGPYVRQVRLQVPRVRLGAMSPTTAASAPSAHP